MSLRHSLIILCLLLTACGFEPLYGEKSEGDKSKLNAGVTIDTISGRIGQIFKARLEDTLNPAGGVPARPAYRLAVSLNHITVPISVARDGTVSRYNITFNSGYVLYRTSDDVPVTSGKLNYITSYNNLTNVYFSTYQSEQDALKRGTVSLAELYRQRLASYLDSGAPLDETIHKLSTNKPLTPDLLLKQKQGNTINLQ